MGDEKPFNWTKEKRAALEAKLDDYWEDLDRILREEAGYTLGREGMGCVILAVKDGAVLAARPYGYEHYIDPDYSVEGSCYENPYIKKIEHPRPMPMDTLFDLRPSRRSWPRRSPSWF